MINLHKRKIKMQKFTLTTNKKRLTPILMAGLLVVGFALSPLAKADQFDDQINALNAENAARRSNLSQLGAEAAGLQETIAKLQAQISALQAQISANQTKHDETVVKIAEAEVELARQKALLAENLKAMYLEGEISTFEMLLSSKDLGEFVDREQYRNTIKNSINDTLTRINELKEELKTQQETLAKIIADLKFMQDQLATQQAEQNRLLSLNQAQQNELDQSIRTANSQVSDLKRQQQAAIAAAARRFGVSTLPSSGNGGYPDVWAYAAPDSMVDSWGMFNRECVSYAAYRVAASGRYMPYWGGVGNAYEWPGNAQRAGIPIGYEPRVGSVAYMDIGYYGHVMYVEEILDGGARIRVSQYNWSPYAYSQMIIPTSGLTFIYF
jgi:peptidoglycan hydrolase CwlO-like protein